MNLDRAIDLVGQAVSRMHLASGSPVFNEWMIISLPGKEAEILYYSGPRSTLSQNQMRKDLRSLEEEMRQDGYTSGQYFFSHNAAGTHYDAFILAGPRKYVLFNNTNLTMKEISSDTFWHQQQIHFVELSERFHMDSLA
jgi:hypothetical protein